MCALPVCREEGRTASPGKFVPTSLLWAAQPGTSAAGALTAGSPIQRTRHLPALSGLLLPEPSRVPLVSPLCLAGVSGSKAALTGSSTPVCVCAQ